MKRSVNRVLMLMGQIAIALVFCCATPIYATTVLAGILYGLIHGLGLGERLTWVEWMIVSPIIYVTWLNSFLIACAIDIQAWRLLFGFRKHRRLTTSNGFRDWLQCMLTLSSYMRERIVWHLPLTQSYMGVNGLRHLVLWSGAPSAKIGRGSSLFGLLYDPDLTEIGEHVILGSDSFIVAHSITVNADGSRVFVTAPVTIGARSLVGGGSRVDLGVQIGTDAIVEPMSYVAAFTTIGDREVWGGNPARFLRMRPKAAVVMPSAEFVAGRPSIGLATTPVAPLSAEHEQALREILAVALDRPINTIDEGLSHRTCAAWDSLGQLGIAAGFRQRLGIELTTQESFRLRSLTDMRQILRERLPSEHTEWAGASQLPHRRVA